MVTKPPSRSSEEAAARELAIKYATWKIRPVGDSSDRSSETIRLALGMLSNPDTSLRCVTMAMLSGIECVLSYHYARSGWMPPDHVLTAVDNGVRSIIDAHKEWLKDTSYLYRSVMELSERTLGYLWRSVYRQAGEPDDETEDVTERTSRVVSETSTRQHRVRNLVLREGSEESLINHVLVVRHAVGFGSVREALESLGGTILEVRRELRLPVSPTMLTSMMRKVLETDYGVLWRDGVCHRLEKEGWCLSPDLSRQEWGDVVVVRERAEEVVASAALGWAITLGNSPGVDDTWWTPLVDVPLGVSYLPTSLCACDASSGERCGRPGTIESCELSTSESDPTPTCCDEHRGRCRADGCFLPEGRLPAGNRDVETGNGAGLGKSRTYDSTGRDHEVVFDEDWNAFELRLDTEERTEIGRLHEDGTWVPREGVGPSRDEFGRIVSELLVEAVVYGMWSFEKEADNSPPDRFGRFLGCDEEPDGIPRWPYPMVRFERSLRENARDDASVRESARDLVVGISGWVREGLFSQLETFRLILERLIERVGGGGLSYGEARDLFRGVRDGIELVITASSEADPRLRFSRSEREDSDPERREDGGEV